VSDEPGAAEPPRGSADARGARGVLAGDFGIQVNVFHGTWTDAMAPPPLADQSGNVESPYRGLSPFEQWDERFFFGRDDAASAVLERVGSSGLLMVSGVSGAGKSSLLRAGVLPRIRDGGLAAPGSASWPRVVLTPTGSPLDELAERVAPVARTDAATVRANLADDPSSFAHTARQAASARSPGPDPGARRLLLVVDQFEQLFTRCPDERQRRAFIGAVHAAANGGADAGPATVILLVRADFEARCAEYAELTSVVRERYLVTSMTERQLRLAITAPAERAGSRVEDELVVALLREMRDAVSSSVSADAPDGWGAGALPLLSHALDQAWRERTGQALTLADYERTGGIEGALAESASRAYQRLTPEQRDVARRVFTRLVATSEDGVDTTDRVARAELTAGEEAADVEQVLETFADSRLLTLAAGTVEISHEVLLTAWPLLRDTWLDEVHADRIVRARLHLAADEWSRNRRDRSYLYQGGLLHTATQAANRIRTDPRHPPLDRQEDEFLQASSQVHRRRTRTRQLVTAVLTVLALGAATLSAVATNRGDQVAARLRAANAETLGRESQRRLSTDVATAAQLALAAWRSDPTSPQARTALANAYLAVSTLDTEITGLASAPIKDVWVRGEAALVTTKPATVVTGITGNEAQRWQVPVPDGTQGDLSPDGRSLAYLTQDGTVGIRDVLARSEPTTVATGQRSGYVKFSPDGRRLAWLTDSGRPNVTELRTCELTECATKAPDPRPLPADRTIYGFWLTSDPNQVLVWYGDPRFSDTSRLVLRSVADGTELATMPPGSAVARDGTTIVSCEEPPIDNVTAKATVVVTPVSGAAPPTRFSSIQQTCRSSMWLSTDGGWLVEPVGPVGERLSPVRLRLTDLGSGLHRWVSVPAFDPPRLHGVDTDARSHDRRRPALSDPCAWDIVTSATHRAQPRRPGQSDVPPAGG
jgi:hypothetical protein